MRPLVCPLLIVVALCVTLPIVHLIPLRQRSFTLNDPDISLSHADHDIVSDSQLTLIVIGLPLLLLSLLCVFWSRCTSHPLFIALSSRCTTPKQTAIYFVICLSMTLLMTEVITKSLKLSVGRLRPDFIDRCQPNLNMTLGQTYYNTSICTGPPKLVKEGQYSFPSGHASLSFSAFLLLSLATMHIISPQVQMNGMKGSSIQPTNPCLNTLFSIQLRWVLTIIFITLATLISVSRVVQHVHNWSDIAAGACIGTLTSLVVWNFTDITEDANVDYVDLPSEVDQV